METFLTLALGNKRETVMASLERKTDQVVHVVQGMDEDQAIDFIKEEGLISRIVHRDGEDFVVTMDLVPNRVNLYIQDGTVEKADVG